MSGVAKSAAIMLISCAAAVALTGGVRYRTDAPSLHCNADSSRHAFAVLSVPELRNDYQEKACPSWSSTDGCAAGRGVRHHPAHQTPCLPACAFGPAICAMDARA